MSVSTIYRLLPLALLPAACAPHPRAPSVVVFGSFFPAWIICALLGVIATLILRKLVGLSGLEPFLPAKLAVYALMMVALSVLFWFVLFEGFGR
jgi:hypothetical protein